MNSAELQKFQKSHSQWWDKKGEFAMLHEITPLRKDYILGQIGKHFQDHSAINLLDVGCGGGLLCKSLYEGGIKNITGIDANLECAEAGKKEAEINGYDIRYYQSTPSDELSKKERYQVITCLEVLEHVDNPGDFLCDLIKLLTKDGILIVSTINKNPKSYLLAIIMAEYVLGLVPRKTHDYKKFLTPSYLSKAARTQNYEIKELAGLTFDLQSGEWILSNDVSVNYFAIIKNNSSSEASN